MADKIDSNEVGLRICEEATYGVEPVSQVWEPYDPNSYSDFGSQIATTARQPITRDRQNRKGVTTDLDASGGFNQDLTPSNLMTLMQGFFFADTVDVTSTEPRNGAAIPITGVTTGPNTFTAASGLDAFQAGELVFAAGYTNAANNGLHKVTTATATVLTVGTTLVPETPPAGDSLTSVGFEFAISDLSITSGASAYPILTSIAEDFTTMPLAAGDWVYIGDGTNDMDDASGNGWFRIYSVTASTLTFDKSDALVVVDAANSTAVRMFWGTKLRNDPLGSAGTEYNRRSYHMERSLGDDGGGTQYEYLVGAVCNELTVNLPLADKITCDMSFVAKDRSTRTGAEGVLDSGGTRATLVESDAFNTTSDVARMRMTLNSATASYPANLFAYLSELNFTISNGVTPNKAIGVLGAFEQSSGNFDVKGTATAYFNTNAAVAAVRNNSDVSVDVALVKDNEGLLFDIPLLSLGDGRLNVTLNEPITLPLEIMGAKDDTLGYTMSVTEFKYLPTVAG